MYSLGHSGAICKLQMLDVRCIIERKHRCEMELEMNCRRASNGVDFVLLIDEIVIHISLLCQFAIPLTFCRQQINTVSISQCSKFIDCIRKHRNEYKWNVCPCPKTNQENRLSMEIYSVANTLKGNGLVSTFFQWKLQIEIKFCWTNKSMQWLTSRGCIYHSTSSHYKSKKDQDDSTIHINK